MAKEETDTYEIKLLTTDQRFVNDMNEFGIIGLKAVYRPEMAFDSLEPIF